MSTLMIKKEALMGLLSNVIDWASGGLPGKDSPSVVVESETALIKSVDVEQRMALFVVLEPQDGDETTDLHGDTYDELEVAKARDNFNAHCMKANLFHEVEIDCAHIVQSFITPTELNLEDGRFIKKGTWLQWWHFPEGNSESDDLWNAVKAGEITGVSIGANANYEEITCE